MESNSNIGETVKEYRLKRGLTLEQVAQATKRTKGYISRLENGSSKFTSEMMAKLKEVLTIPDESFTDEELKMMSSAMNIVPMPTVDAVIEVVDLTILKNDMICLFDGKVVSEDTKNKILELLKSE